MAAKSQPSKSSDPQPIDPTQPSKPVSYPLRTLEELESRSYFKSFHYPFNKASVPLIVVPDRNRPRLLACHDMAGGYLDDDKWVQGGTDADAYSIWHWFLIDVFVYFSHNLVTLPPPSWVNAAHKNGVQVLGTFITGQEVIDELLASTESVRMYAERLTELAVALGFDGWLLNMEVNLKQDQIPNLKEFIGHLSDTMHSSKPGSLVIWYDSVTINGYLSYQNRLSEENKPFFDLCDGLFTNYWWMENYPKLSADLAGDRKFDVYMGIDIFGRNTFGGGQWTTNVALDVIRKADISTALFAPGWVYETKQPPCFQTAQNRWWGLVEKSFGQMHNYPTMTPFYSNFDQGRGHHFSINGRQVFVSDWCNLSCQTFQPFLEYSEDLETDAIQVFVNPREDSYSGGGNLTFKGNLEDNEFVSKRLFQPELPMGDSALQFTYSVKLYGNSLLGLSLKFSTSKGDSVSVLLVSSENALLTRNQFSSKFSSIITPHQVTNQGSSSEGWILRSYTITMPGYTLTKITALCYKLAGGEKPEYCAVLGHFSIKAPGESVVYPPSSAWLMEGKFIHWEGQQPNKSISLNIAWKLKDIKNDFISKFQSYHVYVEKLADGNIAEKLQGEAEYLGVAFVEAFYVYGLLVPPGISGLKFIIQVCGIDGTTQQLDDSPSFLLDVPSNRI